MLEARFRRNVEVILPSKETNIREIVVGRLFFHTMVPHIVSPAVYHGLPW